MYQLPLQTAETGQLRPKVNVLRRTGVHTESKQQRRTRPRRSHTRVALGSGDPGSRIQSTASPSDEQFVLIFFCLLFFVVDCFVFSLCYSAQTWISERMSPSGIAPATCLPHDIKTIKCILRELEIRGLQWSSGWCYQWKGWTAGPQKPAPPSASLCGHATLLLKPLKAQAHLLHTYLLEDTAWGQGPHSVWFLCPSPSPPVLSGATTRTH